MHPATSIIGFTVASGAGYGLLALAITAAILGALPDDRLFAFVVMALGTGLVGAGLVSSTFHLGHPERAWRALSQWRTSWLSREGLAALVTFVPLGIFGIGWVFLGETRGLWALAGLLAVAGAIVSVACTAMIYASLKPIRAWHTPWTPATYYLWRWRAVLCCWRCCCISSRPPPPGPTASVCRPGRRLERQAGVLARHRCQTRSPARPNPPPASAPSAGSARSSRPIRKRTICSRRWAFASPASTPPPCAGWPSPPASSSPPP
jgi:hypothetical protein